MGSGSIHRVPQGGSDHRLRRLRRVAERQGGGLPLRAGIVALAFAAVGCGDRLLGDDATASASTHDTTTSTATSHDGSTSTTGEATTGGDSDTGLASTSTTGDSGDTSGDRDRIKCDAWAQDCPEGEKCMPWDMCPPSTCGWYETKCVPVARDPAEPGEPCHVVSYLSSGHDDCALGSYCWATDPETLKGTFVAQCTGDAADPQCEDDSLVCVRISHGQLALCLPPCDPLAPDCAHGHGCYALQPGVPTRWPLFACYPHAGSAGYAEECLHSGTCAPGFLCADDSQHPDCMWSRCCLPLCDLSDDDPDAHCQQLSPELICDPWTGSEPLGACHVPQ